MPLTQEEKDELFPPRTNLSRSGSYPSVFGADGTLSRGVGRSAVPNYRDDFSVRPFNGRRHRADRAVRTPAPLSSDPLDTSNDGLLDLAHGVRREVVPYFKRTVPDFGGVNEGRLYTNHTFELKESGFFPDGRARAFTRHYFEMTTAGEEKYRNSVTYLNRGYISNDRGQFVQTVSHEVSHVMQAHARGRPNFGGSYDANPREIEAFKLQNRGANQYFAATAERQRQADVSKLRQQILSNKVISMNLRYSHELATEGLNRRSSPADLAQANMLAEQFVRAQTVLERLEQELAELEQQAPENDENQEN